MPGRGQPWETAIAGALGAARRFSTAAHRPWKTLRVSHIPTAPNIPLSLSLNASTNSQRKHERTPPSPYFFSGSSFDENMLYSETEEKGYHLVRLRGTEAQPDGADLDVEFRVSPTRPMVQIHARYENGELQLPPAVSPETLKDTRVKVIVTVAKGAHQKFGREAQEDLREKLLAAGPAELKLKIERETEAEGFALPVSQAHSAEAKLRAYWDLKGAPAAEQEHRLLAKLAQLEAGLYGEDQE
jgi:hypothetical protein